MLSLYNCTNLLEHQISEASETLLMDGSMENAIRIYIYIYIGERAKLVRHYQGCTNSSWSGIHVIVIPWVLELYQNKTPVSRGCSPRVRAFCSDIPWYNFFIPKI